jgi:anaerobic ribonucleoside-triphosphate reductase
MDFLHHICDVAADKGNTYFVFDRGDTAKISECCRLSFKLEASDLEDAKKPWRMRYSALQNITINLPRLAYKAEGASRVMSKRRNLLKNCWPWVKTARCRCWQWPETVRVICGCIVAPI